jgi:ABC-type transport system involved in multi-copper enzyme maturation permease subunit
MPRFWSNPEFVRHRRAELRAARAITVAVVVLLMCVLLGLACWSYQQGQLESTQRAAESFATEAWKLRAQHAQQEFAQQTWLLFYRWLVGLQGVALTFWTLFSCAQSVSGERDRKTWDFQRTTSLTASEILIGKLLGEPILVYFAVLCAAPLTLIAGLAGGLSFGAVISVFILLTVISLFLGLGGMWLSTLLESRTRGVGLIGALALYGITLGSFGFDTSGLPGLAALSPLTVTRYLNSGASEPLARKVSAILFGHAVPWLLMSVLLCGSFSAWLALMLIRNLKRDYPEIRPLSRWQAVGCAAFLNFLIYALLSPSMGDAGRGGSFRDAASVAVFAVAMNGLILFLMGLATLTPQERLKVWRRRQSAGTSALFADDGLPWPWLGISAVVAYALMIWGLLAWDHILPLDSGTLQTAAIRLLLVLVFVTRDVLFLQWCMLTRLRQPVVKGVLFLCLYYAAAAVMTTLAGVSSEDTGRWVLALLTPVQVFDPNIHNMAFPSATYVGLALQIGLIVVLVMAITSRLQRPLRSGAAA